VKRRRCDRGALLATRSPPTVSDTLGASVTPRACWTDSAAVGSCPQPPGGGGLRVVEHRYAAHDRRCEGEVSEPSVHVLALEVIRAFPSWTRSIWAEICLCHACSCHEILRTALTARL
jgi:hypothetical protein